MPHSHLQTVTDTVRAKHHLKEIGLSNRAAAKRLGRSFEHLSRVLNGHRESQRLLTEILALKPRRPSTR